MRLPSLIPYLLAMVAGLSAYFIAQPLLKDIGVRELVPSDKELIGQRRPDFELNDFADRPVPISRYDGQVVLINFWASWCPPCRKEIPEFIDVYNLYHSEGFEIIGIAIDDKRDAEEFIKKIPSLDYPQLIGFDDAIEVAKQFGNRTGNLPYSVLLDRQGIIRAVRAGKLDKDELIDWLEPLLAAGETHSRF